MADDQDVAHAVALKLPPFWPEDPETWIEQVEAQFHIRNITADNTKFYYVVAALDPPTARRLRDTIKTAPEGSRYATLRTRITDTFALTESDRANRILNMHGLGDRKPSELMDEMLALADGHTPCFLFKQVFINQLPQALQVQLATVDFANPRRFSLEADKLWGAKVAAEASSASTINKVNAKVKSKHNNAALVDASGGLCFYHAKFGSGAQKCRAPCHFSGNGQAGRQ
jgi:hypothetical protein